VKSYEEAVRRVLNEFSWNPWFLDSYWPENEPRVRAVAILAERSLPGIATPQCSRWGAPTATSRTSSA
jgi:hypothetical protein